LQAGGDSRIYNLGNQQGFSNLEVLRTVEKVIGQKIPFRIAARRPGDPAKLVASSELIKKELGWRPQFPRLDQIVETAWNWHSRHPEGYGDQ
jgi:UDP-glucose 4-epimerase